MNDSISAVAPPGADGPAKAARAALIVARDGFLGMRATGLPCLPQFTERALQLIEAALYPPPSLVVEPVDRSLLRKPVKNISEISKNIPGGCYCPPDRCGAPVIHGRQTPCLRRQAARGIDSPEGAETHRGSTAKPQAPGRDSDAPKES